MTDEPGGVSGDDLSPGGSIPDEPATRGVYGSLRDDVSALYEDTRTYIQAELAFQKSRIGFAAHHTRYAAMFGIGAATFLHLALLGTVVGLIIALQPYLGAFGAMALMVAITLAIAAIFGFLALRRFKKISRAFDDGDET